MKIFDLTGTCRRYDENWRESARPVSESVHHLQGRTSRIRKEVIEHITHWLGLRVRGFRTEMPSRQF